MSEEAVNDLGEMMKAFFDRWMFRHLEASFHMSELEKLLSDNRSEFYQAQWEIYKSQQRDKYGLDGGPSPCVVFNDPFLPGTY